MKGQCAISSGIGSSIGDTDSRKSQQGISAVNALSDHIGIIHTLEGMSEANGETKGDANSCVCGISSGKVTANVTSPEGVSYHEGRCSTFIEQTIPKQGSKSDCKAHTETDTIIVEGS